MRLVVLGSGTSFGVPVIGCDCAVCTSDDPRDRRTRTSAIVESESGSRLLIDTPPELRLQLVAQGIESVDAVLYTHGHADHLHGIDDLRAISQRRGSLSLYGSQETIDGLVSRFHYIFDPSVRPPPGTSKPVLEPTVIEPFHEVEIAGFSVVPLDLDHGGTRVFGYRIGDLVYVTDAKEVSDRAVEIMAGARVFVINALFEQAHATHLSIPEAVVVAERVGAERTFLTHLTHRYGHSALDQRLPDGVSPAYDGLTVAF